MNDGWRTFTFDYFWEQVLNKDKPRGKSSLSKAERDELVVEKGRNSFSRVPHSLCSAILHRVNGKAEVTPVYIRNGTVWNRIYAEWTHFPYMENENVALYASVDSSEFLGQLLTPLLAGRTIITVEIQDLNTLVERVEQWKIVRLTCFPLLIVSILHKYMSF